MTTKWHSTSEQPPPENDAVLVYYTAGWQVVAYFHDGAWRSCETGEATVGRATHWTELPTRPT